MSPQQFRIVKRCLPLSLLMMLVLCTVGTLDATSDFANDQVIEEPDSELQGLSDAEDNLQGEQQIDEDNFDDEDLKDSVAVKYRRDKIG
ncbi:hypothetical protein BOX15_Mlig027769g2 [Macrostomum lignano]|uniref:Uncharacterized protein n=1 Tax=Macrostomum lignano TaxID=282301 RepID=A0A267H511_9PLAT|nr:hypothetical protein BOX15_Mlig027769g3 [Macrostomum lignano]PAA90917.1 hypothetical protein BOX15_Mlig027769g1 [Macrostomum lignano]PAA93370.1 hypothetical protein BOX15_Mlig027769g2 [Macrostomum lignano]